MPRVDDPTISDDAALLHAVYKDQILKNPDGVERPQSQAFRWDDQKEVSALIRGETDLDRLVKAFPDSRICWFTAGEARSLGYSIHRDPTEQFHSHVVMCHQGEHRQRKAAKQLALLARLIT
jgi:hypothetical protein